MAMHVIEVSDSDIDKLIQAVMEKREQGGSKYPGMSYEDGIIATLDWLTGHDDAHPYDDE